jgi:HTH-type transcriptional regulator / antitoxin HigA
MTLAQINKTKRVWSSLSQIVQVPHTEKEYRKLVLLFDGLIDEVGEDENHPLASLIEVIGVLIEKYEDEHVPHLPKLMRRALTSSKGTSLPEGMTIKDLVNAGRNIDR